MVAVSAWKSLLLKIGQMLALQLSLLQPFTQLKVLRDAVQRARQSTETYVAFATSFETLLTSTDPTVTIGTAPNDVTVVPYGYLAEQFDLVSGLITTDVIANSTAYAADKVIITNGYAISGDGGGGQWKQNGVTGQTPSQSPSDLVDSLINDANGDQWELVNDVFNVKSLGAINSTTIANDSTSAFAALAAACLRTKKEWEAHGDFYVEKAEMYTTGHGDLTLHSINNEQSYGVLTVLPDPADLASEAVSEINTLLPLSKGLSNIPSLGIYENKFIRVATSERYINRKNSTTSYRYELHL